MTGVESKGRLEDHGTPPPSPPPRYYKLNSLPSRPKDELQGSFIHHVRITATHPTTTTPLLSLSLYPFLLASLLSLLTSLLSLPLHCFPIQPSLPFHATSRLITLSLHYGSLCLPASPSLSPHCSLPSSYALFSASLCLPSLLCHMNAPSIYLAEDFFHAITFLPFPSMLPRS